MIGFTQTFSNICIRILTCETFVVLLCCEYFDMNIEYAYRATETTYAPPVDEYDQPLRICDLGRIVVHIHRYPIIKRTPCGMWIDVYGDKKFVLLTATKQFACESIELAKQSFVARKKRQLAIYQAKMRKVVAALALADDDQFEICWTESI